MSLSPSSHRWRFFRAGGADQVALETADDLRHLEQLDRTLWVELACPVDGLELDRATLTLIDTDGDGRIRHPEILAAVRWALARLRDPAVLFRGGDLALADLDDGSPEGAALKASAVRILTGLGKPDATTVSVADAAAQATVFANTRCNGDGIVPIAAIDDGQLKAAAESIAATHGAVTDSTGAPGLDQPTIDRFFADAEAYAGWWAAGEGDAARLPLGADTAAAAAAYTAVRAKVDDFFARTKLAAFDERALHALERQEQDYLAIAAQDLHLSADEIEGFPLARIAAGRPLPLTDGVNPAWTSRVAAFRDRVVTPLLGDRTALTEAEWTAIGARVAPYLEWQGAQQGGAVAPLGITRIRELLSGGSRLGLTALVTEDAAAAPEMAAIADVERLARYQRDLAILLHNFVAFRDFYGRERPAVFQAGTLVLDGRACALAVRVTDAGAHAALAGLAKTYLAYCTCTRAGSAPMTIAAAFTDGDGDNLMVGRNGVFWDREGRDWDATVTKLVENPISIREAFWAPYKKLVRLIEEQVAKRAAAGAAASDERIGAAAAGAATADQAAAAAPPGPKKIDVGTVAALGVAFGALMTALAAIAGYVSGLLALPFWKLTLAVLGLAAVVSAPSMLIAWLKLRQRNLGPILDAGGWAINGRVRMNVPFGAALTTLARLPAGAQASFAVKYPEPPSVLPRLALGAVTIAFVLSLLAEFGLLPSLAR